MSDEVTPLSFSCLCKCGNWLTERRDSGKQNWEDSGFSLEHPELKALVEIQAEKSPGEIRGRHKTESQQRKEW